MYANTPENLSMALRRLIGKRLPLQPGEHEMLFENQRTNLPTYKGIYEEFAQQIAPYFDSFHGSLEEARDHYQDPHPKKGLRILAWDQLDRRGWRSLRNHPWVLKPEVKMKLREYAKAGKKPRTIVDMAVPASLAGFRVTEVFKYAMACESFYTDGGEARFVKSPTQSAMRSAFEFIRDANNKYNYVYFSDDAMLSICHSDGTVTYYNLDISSCDASHTEMLFDLMCKMVPEHVRPDMERLKKQCEATVKIKHPCRPEDKDLHVHMKPVGAKLFTGSTITTLINNLANTLIFAAICRMGAETPAQIAEAAKSVGYTVTGVEPLENFRDLQFLKNSPVLDVNGNLQPLLNLGVMLRASGSCHGDLPGRGSWEARARKFQTQLVRSAYPRAHFNLRSKLSKDPITLDLVRLNDFDYKIDERDTDVDFDVSSDEVYYRYRLSQEEIVQLEDEVGLAGFGDSVNTSAVKRILLVDYQMSTTDVLTGCELPLQRLYH